MRIIAGSARGRTLYAPRGQDTRPTQDYVRESLFNILQRDVPDARILDLFAGSGALGLEALSRGAETAVFADVAAEAIACIRRNVDTLGFTDRATITKGDWQTTLGRLAGEERHFSLVFLDPPYRMEDTGAQCARMADLKMLENGALIVIEHRHGCAPMPDERFTQRDARRYGDTEINFFTYAEGGA
ncbi:MAG: 16S rRNA (guanine(966)-N(2))-methyltransferase RsmD [Eubacteriales bacterium]|nr:16S rRNA (guanine(966)-N(2))-methyltransferase RsmD [Eubacteriales bacterium]